MYSWGGCDRDFDVTPFLQPFYAVDFMRRSGSDELTPALLSNYSQVWILKDASCGTTRTPPTANEIAAVVSYYNAGGKLMFSVDDFKDPQELVDLFAHEFGVDFYGTVMSDGYCIPTAGANYALEDHPIWNGVNNMRTSMSESYIGVTNPDVEIIARFEGTPAEGVLAEPGKGCVYFQNCYFRYQVGTSGTSPTPYAGTLCDDSQLDVKNYILNTADWLDSCQQPQIKKDILVYAFDINHGQIGESSYDVTPYLQAMGYSVDYLERTGPDELSQSLLSGYDQVWLIGDCGTEFGAPATAAELTELEAFRDGGGKLAIIADNGPPSLVGADCQGMVNPVANMFGVNFYDSVTSGFCIPPDSYGYNHFSHPIWNNINYLRTTSSDALLQITNTNVEIISEHSGTPTNAVLVESGKGCIFFDNTLSRYSDGGTPPWNSGVCADGTQEPLKFLENLAGWLDSCTPVIIIPHCFDWRGSVEGEVPNSMGDGTTNWMTSIKNQGSCGSCWAFSTLGVTESKYHIEQNRPLATFQDLDLSEQWIVSTCYLESLKESYGNNYGQCNGGWPTYVMQYLMSDMVVTEECWNYKDVDGQQYHSNCPDMSVSTTSADWGISGYNRQTLLSVAAMKSKIVNGGPVAVLISMRVAGYTGYLVNDAVICPSTSQYDHGVIIVGYCDDPQIPSGGYWIVKNSWGNSWTYGAITSADGTFKVAYDNCLIQLEGINSWGVHEIPV